LRPACKAGRSFLARLSCVRQSPFSFEAAGLNSKTTSRKVLIQVQQTHKIPAPLTSITEKFNGMEADRNDMAFNAGYSLDGPRKAHGLRNMVRVDHLTSQNHLARFNKLVE
jgi:hypothetical protein